MAKINKTQPSKKEDLDDDLMGDAPVQESEKTLSKKEQDEKAALRAELKAELEAELKTEQALNAKEDALDLFADYKAPENEKHLFHVSLEKILYSKSTGRKISKPYVQKFTDREFEDLKKYGAGFTIVVLHDPTKGEDK